MDEVVVCGLDMRVAGDLLHGTDVSPLLFLRECSELSPQSGAATCSSPRSAYALIPTFVDNFLPLFTGLGLVWVTRNAQTKTDAFWSVSSLKDPHSAIDSDQKSVGLNNWLWINSQQFFCCSSYRLFCKFERYHGAGGPRYVPDEAVSYHELLRSDY